MATTLHEALQKAGATAAQFAALADFIVAYESQIYVAGLAAEALRQKAKGTTLQEPAHALAVVLGNLYATMQEHRRSISHHFAPGSEARQ